MKFLYLLIADFDEEGSMRWIEGVEWDGYQFGLRILNATGNSEIAPVSMLSEISCRPEEANVRRIRVKSSFRDWRPISADALRSTLQLPASVGDGMDVYAFEAEGKTFHVPTVVLMQGMFRPLRRLAPYLFKPQGLEHVVVSVPDINGTGVEMFRCARKALRTEPARAKGILEALSWMHGFPSANAMWHSVLTHARQGRLGMSMPKATGTLVLRTLEVAGVWLVVELTVSYLEAMEEPFEYALKHKRIIDFHQGAHTDFSAQVQAPKKLPLPTRNGCWKLSDSEWNEVSMTIAGKSNLKYCQRTIVDAILEKFGRGIPWRRLDCSGANRPTVVATYQQMQRDGRWERLLAKLGEVRGH